MTKEAKKRTTKRAVIITSIIVFFVVLYFTVGRKIQNLKKIEFTGASFKFTQTPSSIVNILSEDFVSKVTLKIQNFSNIDYKIDQSNIGIYSKKGNLIASPTNPINSSIILNKNSNNEIPISYRFDYTSLITLIKDNGLANSFLAAYNVIKSYITTKKLNTEIITKGFIVSNGITININESNII